MLFLFSLHAMRNAAHLFEGLILKTESKMPLAAFCA